MDNNKTETPYESTSSPLPLASMQADMSAEEFEIVYNEYVESVLNKPNSIQNDIEFPKETQEQARVLDSSDNNGTAKAQLEELYSQVSDMENTIKTWEANAQKSIKRCARMVNRIESFSRESSKATNAIKNLFRIATGRQAVARPEEVGKFASDLAKPYREMIGRQIEIRDSAITCINSIEKAIEKVASRTDASQEKKAVNEAKRDFKDIMKDAG